MIRNHCDMGKGVVRRSDVTQDADAKERTETLEDFFKMGFVHEFVLL